MKVAKQLGIFFAVQALFAAISWLGGYNFNERDPVVAYVASLSVTFGLLAATFDDV